MQMSQPRCDKPHSTEPPRATGREGLALPGREVGRDLRGKVTEHENEKTSESFLLPVF